MKRVGRKEFFSYINRYLVPGEYVITKHGRDDLLIRITSMQKEVVLGGTVSRENEAITPSFLKERLIGS